MKIKDKNIEQIVSLVLNGLKSKQLIKFKTEESKVHSFLITAMQKEMKLEVDLDHEARILLEEHLRQAGPAAASIDKHRMFLMIKKKLAEQKGIVL